MVSEIKDAAGSAVRFTVRAAITCLSIGMVVGAVIGGTAGWKMGSAFQDQPRPQVATQRSVEIDGNAAGGNYLSPSERALGASKVLQRLAVIRSKGYKGADLDQLEQETRAVLLEASSTR